MDTTQAKSERVAVRSQYYYNQFRERASGTTANFSGDLDLMFQRSRALGGKRLDPGPRDIDNECGYEPDPNIDYYRAMYDRVGIASRVVNIWPDECWAAFPEVYEVEEPEDTEFETAWKELERKILPWHYLHRVDRLSGVGEFGVLLMGFADGLSMESPVRGVAPDTGQRRPNTKVENELIYLRAFDQSRVRVVELERRPYSRRFGLPTRYEIQFDVPTAPGQAIYTTAGTEVHWTRVLHVADDLESSEVFAVPRLKHVLNDVYDVRKVSGSSAEMFWKGGFPGLAFETWPELVGADIVNEEDMKAEVEAYVSGLQRYLTSVGGSWKSLAQQVADPSKNIESKLQLICAAIGVPLRIFLGSEAAHLASTQDIGTWKGRLKGRQKNYLEPRLLVPFFDRLLSYGCLPLPAKGYHFGWPDLNASTDAERADIALKKVQALGQFVTGGVNNVMSLNMLYTLILGFTVEETAAVLRELAANPPAAMVLPGMLAGPQDGGRNGSANKNDPGRPAGKTL